MKVIVGLGNPGKKYSMTRHNLGFIILDELSDRFGLKFKSGKGDYLISSNNDVILMKPLTYMNNSGIAVRELMEYFDISTTDLLVVFDDLDLPFGKIRIRTKGSSGGHKGLESILYHLNTDLFNRIKVGISNEKREFIEADKFVLGKFLKKEVNELDRIINQSIDIIKEFIANGIGESIKFNNKNNLITEK
ncbi:MAG: aminoacyl-tRNA hydrolase [Candidatus Marinimicrobia bacterium]|nr:aminoacyl-tRNA hydrolase [Candidatus Neomarinimicrobiota bacterium]